MKKYFRLTTKKSENGSIIELDTSKPDETRLSDFVSSYRNVQDNLAFRVFKKESQSTIYEVVIPQMQFSAGACAPALAVASGLGWARHGQKKLKLKLTSKGNLSSLEKGIDIEEITPVKAQELKHEEFLYSMQQLWIAGY